MLKKLNRISTESRFQNPYWEYRLDNYKMPSGDEGEYHYVRTNGSTMIIPVTEDKKFLLIRQYRYLNQRESIEFPGGGIKKGLSPEQNAREELLEETGYKCISLRFAGVFNPFNGVTDELCKVYVAEGLENATPRPDISEEFEILELTMQEIVTKIESNEIWDGMTLASWTLFKKKGSEKEARINE